MNQVFFEPIDFQSLNETDIREEIIAPLLRKLGYRSGTKNNIIREQILRYPREFLGRKNAKKDPILRGIADYILEADLTVRWVIEAKAPDVEIDLNSIEQAYTYANHPEVRAVYFALCNGKKLIIFQTNLGPDAKSILELNYSELEDKFYQITNLLSPASILRDNPVIALDTREPIGEGLRSVVRITNGIISYHHSSVNIPALREMQTCISGGSVERDENGVLIAYLDTVAPTRSLQNLNQRLGLTSFEMFSTDKFISSSVNQKTTFKYNKNIILPQGEKILDINSWREIQLPHNISCDITSEATGHLDKNKFFGSFISKMKYNHIPFPIILNGNFEIYVA